LNEKRDKKEKSMKKAKTACKTSEGGKTNSFDSGGDTRPDNPSSWVGLGSGRG
jgi:hypothetical protein